MRGIIMAGGTGSRLYPLTAAVSKQLMPVYDKPLIYYPLATCMQLGIKEIALITASKTITHYRDLLRDGSQWGIQIRYIVQENPNGIAEAFILAENFVGEDNICLLLGDNIFAHMKYDQIKKKTDHLTGAIVFGVAVTNPHLYGVIELDKQFNVKSIEEKPDRPKSNYAIPGLYLYDSSVVEIAKGLEPSPRGELEITDINNIYRKNGQIRCIVLDNQARWFDAGTPDRLLDASNYIREEQRKGNYIAVLEEIALDQGFINVGQFISFAEKYRYTRYGKHLLHLLEMKQRND